MTLPVHNKLPVMAVVAAAFRLPVQMKTKLWAAVRWPLSVFVLLQVMSVLAPGTLGQAEGVGLLLVFGVLAMAVTAMVAVPAHQVFIRGAVSHGGSGIQFGGRELAYLGWSLGLPAIVLVLASLISMPLLSIAFATGVPGFANLAVLVGMLAGVAVYGRFTLVMPRVALGLQGGLRAAANQSKGQTWRIGIIGVVFPLVISLVPVVLQNALAGGVGALLALLVSVYFSLVQIAALSLVYRWLLEFQPAGTDSSPDRDEDDDQGHGL